MSSEFVGAEPEEPLSGRSLSFLSSALLSSMPRGQAAGGGASPAASVYDEEDMSLMGTGKQERGYERRRGASGRLKCAFCFSLRVSCSITQVGNWNNGC